MEWYDVLFLHWPVPPSELSPRVPDGLKLETFDGSAWLGIVPFRMRNIRPRGVPSVPAISNFPELNIRTYVTDGEVSGVWFFSLDASSWTSVQLARWFYALNYYHATMSVEQEDGRIRYTSRRRNYEQGDFQFDSRYGPTSASTMTTGERERFLTERYFLFSEDAGGSLYRGRIAHPEWELHEAEADILKLEIDGHPSPPDESPASVLYSPEISVQAWFPRSINSVD